MEEKINQLRQEAAEIIRQQVENLSQLNTTSPELHKVLPERSKRRGRDRPGRFHSPFDQVSTTFIISSPGSKRIGRSRHGRCTAVTSLRSTATDINRGELLVDPIRPYRATRFQQHRTPTEMKAEPEGERLSMFHVKHWGGSEGLGSSRIPTAVRRAVAT